MQMQKWFYAVDDGVVTPGDAVDRVVAQEAVERSDYVDCSLPYLVLSMFCSLKSLVNTSNLYTLKDNEFEDWPKVIKGKYKKKAPVLFWNVPVRGLEALEIKRQGGSDTQVL